MHQTAGPIKRKGHVPPSTANLPPLGSANDPLHHVFTSKRLDKIYCGFVAGGGGNYEADDMDPRRRRGTHIYEGLQFFDRVPWMENRKLSMLEIQESFIEWYLVATSRKFFDERHDAQ